MNQIGKVTREFAPSKENQRNSEGAFITLEDGRLMFAYTQYRDGWHDYSPADIAVIYSADDGETWTEPHIIFEAELYNAQNIMSVSILRLNSGDIGLFYLVKQGFHDCRLVMHRSSDEGATYGEAVYCIERMGFNVVNNDRVVLLDSGRLIIPSAHHSEPAQERRNLAFPHALDYFYYSDDDGATWLETESCVALNSPHSRSGLQEPGLIELKPGILWAWARTDMGRQYDYYSYDNGYTWSMPQPSRFTSPCSPLSMKRIPGTDKLLAIWNPIPTYPTFKLDIDGCERKRLVYSIGTVNGTTWTEPIILEDETDAGYCYTAIHFHKDSVLLSYCAGYEPGYEDEYCILSRQRIRKIKISSL